MGRSIKINCRHVYESGLKYEDEAEKIEQVQRDLLNAGENIDKIWPSDDGHNFILSFNEHIKSLNNIIEFLDEEAFILKGSALEHGTIDNEFSEKMKRSDIDEQD